MPTWIAALIAAGALTATYFSCVRPHLRGRGHRATTATRGTDLDRQIADLREEIRMLRAQDSLDSGRVSDSRPTPPAEL